jgi:uncharacterized RDD family membrane protein YckC
MNQENRYQPPQSEVADVASHDGEEFASRGARFGGALLDGLFASLVIFPFRYFSGILSKILETGGAYDFGIQLKVGLVGIVTLLVLQGYLLHQSGQTIGKRIVGTRIVAVDDNRILPLWKIFVLRYLTTSIAGQIPVIGGFYGLIDALFVFRADKRCLHDLIAGTKVVNANVAWKGSADVDAAHAAK